MKNLKVNSSAFKKKLKLNLQNMKIFASFVLGGAYLTSCFAGGFSNVNKTIQNAYYEIVYDSDELMDPKYNNNYSNIDYDAMSKVRILTIDMAEIHDLYYLKYYTNLECLQIYNAQELSQLNIDEINQSSAFEINLLFSKSDVIKDMKSHFDMSRFANKKFIKNVSFFDICEKEELDNLILLTYLTNYDGCDIDIYKYEDLNNKLNEIINSFNFHEGKETNILNMFEIVNYVLNELKYDEDVSKYIHSDDKNLKMEKIIDKYNENTLSIIFDEDKDKENGNAICVNYANLFQILLIKSGFEAYTMYGKAQNISHAWNLVNFHGDYFYMDLTSLDNKASDYFESLNKYNSDNNSANLSAVASMIFMDLNQKSYTPFFDYTIYCRDEQQSVGKFYAYDKIYGTNKSLSENWLKGTKYGIILYVMLVIYVIGKEIISTELKEKNNTEKEKTKIK